MEEVCIPDEYRMEIPKLYARVRAEIITKQVKECSNVLVVILELNIDVLYPPLGLVYTLIGWKIS